MTFDASISSWLDRQGFPAERLTPLTGDVSSRRYLRLESGAKRAILAVYPESIRDACRRFLTTTDLLTSASVRVPAVIAHDCRLGVMLLEDLGDRTLYDLPDLDGTRLAAFFWHASANIPRIQALSRRHIAELNPALDACLLRRELHQTWDCYLLPCGVGENRELAEELPGCLDELCNRLAADDLVPCHRDYMARNLVPVEPHPTLAVLDHQDLRLGPRYYDLASLLNDSLFPPVELEERILARSLAPGSEERLRYHRAAAQRTLKAVGTYEMFALRGHERHRALIQPTLERALGHLEKLPEISHLVTPLDRCLRPSWIC